MPMPPMGSGNNGRKTPPDLFKRYNDIHHFTLDGAASHENALVDRYCTIDGTYERYPALSRGTIVWIADGDGLRQSWQGHSVFLNPPYGRGLLAPFVEKAWRSNSVHSTPVVALLPVRTDQEWFHSYVWDYQLRHPREWVEIEFLRGRVKYDGLTTGAAFPSMVVTWKGR
jgi:site-specific DNA-methyltransferase (adenine-specific)